MSSIVNQVFLNAEENPDKVALTDGKNSLSYKELCKQIIFSKGLLKEKYGIKEGDKVIICANKQLSFVSVYFACHLLGAVSLPLPPDINERRLRLISDKVNPVLSVGLASDILKCQYTEIEEFNKSVGNYSYSEVIFPNMDNLADIIFTTGTTGEPKGVTLSQINIEAAALNINTFIRNTKDDVEMLALPISHSFGLGRLRCALSNGQTVVILGSFANMKRFFRYVEEYNVTGFGMVPASWAMIKKLSGSKIGEYADRLNYVEIGSAPMAMDDKKLLIELLPTTRICMHYGLTEASRSAFMEFHEEINHLDTIGKQSPNMTIKIVDERGKEVPFGTEGEMCVKGLAVTKGYYMRPDVNEESFFGDFFRTGDWGVMFEDGHIKLCSRKKELINVGGKKVSPLEVEEILGTLDYIDECVCVAIPDPNEMLGEVVKGYIVTSQPEKIVKEEINKFLSGQIEEYKIPVEYEVIDEIPKTNSGKIQRLLLKRG